MLRRLAALFDLYAARQLQASCDGPAIHDRGGTRVGHVDRIAYADGRLVVEGWVAAEAVRLVHGAASVSCPATLQRADVAASGLSGAGFCLSVPAMPGNLRRSAPPGLIFETGGLEAGINNLSLPRPPLGRWHLVPGFALRLLRAMPAAIGWRLTRNPHQRARVKALLGFSEVARPGPLLPGMIRSEPHDPPITAPDVTIVLPVYNGFDLLLDVLTRIEAHTDIPWHLILIEDCSTDVRVRPFLQDWATEPARLSRVTLLENRENVGFIRSVNRGFRAALARKETGPILLLNSDAMLPAHWATRLLRPFAAHERVASVTPASNAAEILSAPVICRDVPLRADMAEAIDQVAARLDPDGALADLPTGIGFCMAISRAWLSRCPRFDETFGRGYGEEVDWCRRILAMGGRHLGHMGVFVEHQGGASFGAEKASLLRRNNVRLGVRYPGYEAAVAAFKSTDPLRTARLALGLAWAGAATPLAPVEVILGHSLGGGVERAIRDRVARGLASGRAVIRLDVGGAQRWTLRLITPWGESEGACDDTSTITELLSILPRKHIVYACGVGDRDPVELPAILRSLIGPADTAELEVHDYFPLSPSYTLLDSHGVFHGLPSLTSRDRAHRIRRPDGCDVSLAAWRAAWHGFAKQASITCFSEASAKLVRGAWPDLVPAITVAPHGLRLPSQVPVVRHPNRPPTLGILGAIGPQKGAAIVSALASLCAETGHPRLVMIGRIAPGFSLPPDILQTGPYRPEEIQSLAEQHGVTHWLIPSIWPETFCYALHEALATGRPVYGFDLGAQGETLASAWNGHVLPFLPDDPQAMARAVISALATCALAERHAGITHMHRSPAALRHKLPRAAATGTDG
ncbi:glycosyltransferase [Roseivivax sp. THAF30]|uniref:glycosyltransferase n=1 Tax=Roseivivax sp. THAF30 TaxID=2587852 RepID=UPI00126960D7|nr:glycosyltransferase [Roseivivax sp. THAF30]QFT61376.1 N-glycosyltransferase [Roseivivax sp. THAF30]